MHGGFKIAHPLADPDLDSLVSEPWDKNWKYIDFGLALTFTLIQKLIHTNTCSFEFSESLKF